MEAYIVEEPGGEFRKTVKLAAGQHLVMLAIYPHTGRGGPRGAGLHSMLFLSAIYRLCSTINSSAGGGKVFRMVI